MVRKLLCAVVVTAFAVTAVNAEDFSGKITKVSDDKITIAKQEGKGKDAKFGDPQDYKLSKDVKVSKLVGFGKDAKKEALDDGLKNKMFKDIGEKGIRGRFTINDDKEVTEIGVFAGPPGFQGKITKISENSLTFAKQEGFGKKAKFGDPQDYKISKDVKVTNLVGKGKDAKREALEDGLKNKMFTDISEKGLNARIVVNGDNVVTEINLGGGGKGGGKGGKGGKKPKSDK